MGSSIERGAGEGAPPAFAELCAKSCFSLLEGASQPAELVERAHALGLAALGLADRNGVHGVVRAHAAARKLGLGFVVGAEVPVGVSGVSGAAVVLLAATHEGYARLSRLLTLAHADLPREEALLDLDALCARPAGLFAIAVEGGAWLGPLAESFRERAFVAACRRLDGHDRERELRARTESSRHGLAIVATARPLFAAPERRRVADVLQCIREGTTLDEAGARLAPNAEAHLRSPAEMARLFRDAPDRVARTLEIASACTFSLAELSYAFPSDELSPGETPDGRLRRLVERGCGVRYARGVPAAVRAQIEHELAIVEKLGVAPFFLSVHEIVEIARGLGILCQGRGSAANSAVCYVLGITAVDPARSSLLFERFLSVERGEPPDIDVDFEHERREEVIQAIYAKYGRERAAMVSEVISYRGKSALRETAKAFGLSLEQVDRLAGLVSSHGHFEVRLGRDRAPLEAAHGSVVSGERLREAGFDPDDGRLRRVLEIAGELQGLPRHLATHVGGFVLSAKPLDELAPVEPAKMPGRTVVPWDKDDVDALGLFKVDVLGLGMLTAIRKALALVLPGRCPIEALAAIPPEDPRVYDAICEADTVGVFQIESRAQMAMLPRLRPRTFYDLVIEVAIVRPGPIQGGMVHPYLRRRAGEEPVTMPHPSLGGILGRTLGVPLFQEQVMQLAIEGAGYSGGEADELRRDMAAWRKNGRLLRHRERLLAGFVARGVDASFAERLFEQIKGFGEYGFPESHAASFALLVYASAWLKVHHPAAFVCALLNAQPMGFYGPSQLVQDAQRHGVVVAPVDVGASLWDCTLEGGALRLGLRLVKGVGEDHARALVEAREAAPFRDVVDFATRAGVPRNVVERLAESGALASLEPARRQAMWAARTPDAGPLFAGRASGGRRPRLAPLPPAEQLLLDYATTGLAVDDHPLRHLRAALDARGVVSAVTLRELTHGARASVAGLVLSRQRPVTASGVVFLSIEDETAVANLILRPAIFEEHFAVAKNAHMVVATGRVERTPREPVAGRVPVVHVLVETLERLAPARGGEISARSRDFH